MENPLKMEVLLGKSSVNGPFSIAMLVYQRVRMSFRHVACWKMLWMVGLTSWVSIQKKDVENLHQIILDHVLRETLAGNSTSLFPDVSLEIGSDFIIFYPKDTGCWYCQIVWVEWPEKKHLQDWRSRDSWPLGNPFMFICCACRYTWVHDLKHFQVPLSLHLPVSPSGSEWLAPAIHFSIFSWTMILHDSPTFPGYISTFAFLSWFHIPICWLPFQGSDISMIGPRQPPSDLPNPFRFNGFARDGSRLLLLLPCTIDIGFKPELYCHLLAELFRDHVDWIGFVGKILTGNHRFSHEDHGAFLQIFP